MTDRERLIYLFQDIKCKHYFLDNKDMADLADYLLANGVVVPPCKIGTIVYEIRAKGKGSPRGRFYNYSITTNCSLTNAIERGLSLCIEQKLFVKTDMARWGKTVFLTREEAEKVLRGVKNEMQDKA